MRDEMIMMVSNYNVTDEQTLLEKAQALDVVSAIFVLIIDIMFPICLYNYCHQSLCVMFSVYLSVFPSDTPLHVCLDYLGFFI